MDSRIRKAAMLLGIGCTMGLTACQSEEAATESVSLEITKSSYNQDVFYEDYNSFSLNLLNNCAIESGNDANVMISPASVMLALEMAEAGAAGQTGEEITAMICPDAERNEVQSFAMDMAEKLQNAFSVDINVANSVWINEDTIGEQINGDYVNYLEDNFGALASTVPFNDAALGEINAWVNDNTNGMIDEIIDQFDSNTSLVLVNAIAFEGDWEQEYTDHQVYDETFTNSDQTTSSVSMLHGTQQIYFESELATGFQQNYQGGEYAFVAILPKENQSANEFLSEFTAEEYQKFIDSANTDCAVLTQMPEFTSDYDIEMGGILAGPMGMPTAFDEERADFSGMLLPGSEGLYIGRVIHKTYIELNRTGTSAAAATAVEMRQNCVEAVEEVKEVVLNRPFVYAIVDTETMTPIFIGTMNVMAE